MGTPDIPPRPRPTARELRGDIVLAVVILVGAVFSAALSSIAGVYGDEQAPLPLAVGYAFALAAPLAVRRRWPSVVAVLVSLAYFVAVTLHIPEIYVGNIAMFIALYTVGAWSTDRRRAAIVRIAIIIGMFAWLLVVMYRDAIEQADDAEVMAGAFSPFLAYMLITTMVNVLYFGGAYYFGERAWASAAQRAALEQRTLDLERERELTGAQAVALDRVRIARELHDVVAHHVSVMGVQAGAARAVIDRDPAAAKTLLAGVEESAREAIRDLRNLLETLRAPEGPDAATAPDGSIDDPSTVGLDDLDALATASTSAGLATTMTVVGDPVPIAGVVQVNLYRVAQEALTNARRHAGTGATAEVRLRYADDTVELEITNTGRAVGAVSPGLGHLGMRERAAASGGTIDTGPRERGGFRVRVRVPIARPAAQSGAPAASGTEGSGTGPSDADAPAAGAIAR
ncbi:sensor histidine kinase [Micromonospora sp. DT81.3]|uniref:sensor histidine kinase n=1 Tax=Micromonospora sp. DT81.3 TaxID=3416523 RepID=UPI003CF62CE4